MKNDPFLKKNFFPNSICSICNLCLTFLFSGQSQPRKGPLLGSRDNPDVIEIEEVLHLKILQLSINHPSIIPHQGQLMIFRRQNKKLTFGLNYQNFGAKYCRRRPIWDNTLANCLRGASRPYDRASTYFTIFIIIWASIDKMLIIVAQSQGELAQAVPAQDNDRVPPNGELADHYLQIFAKTKTPNSKCH